MISGVNFVHKSVSETVRFWDNMLTPQLGKLKKGKYVSMAFFPSFKGILPFKILDCCKENPFLFSLPIRP